MDIKSDVRGFVVENFIPVGFEVPLDDSTPLITGGLIDSIGMIGLVRFIEGRFGITFVPREVDPHSLDTLERIESLVSKKLTETQQPLR
jgi:acyl carrier protein